MAPSDPRRNPPLAGRPPFATDEPDDIYDDEKQSAPRRRQRQPRVEDNRPDSSYDVYDNYLNVKDEDTKNRDSRASGYGDVGLGFLNGDLEDEDSDDETLACPVDPKHSAKAEEKLDIPVPAIPPQMNEKHQPALTIVAPKPGYAAAVSALADNLARPEPAVSPTGSQRDERLPSPDHLLASPRVARFPAGGPPSSPTVPSTPHPLLPPITPITPAFALPPQRPIQRDVKFSDTAILRGKNEEALLPKRGEKGDDFWRRFSMVVKVESSTGKDSWWLQKTQGGAARLSRYVWVVGVILLLVIGGAIGLGWYESHNQPADSPKAIGGSANEGVSLTISTSTTSAIVGALGGATSSSPHVSPTNTVAKRYPDHEPEPTPNALEYEFMRREGTTNRSWRHRNTQRRFLD